jgi:hypothetical protein
MGVLEVVGGFATNPGATTTALTASTGDSFTVRSFDATQAAYLLGAWGQEGSAGFLQIRSPRMHDNVRGIRLPIQATTTRDELGYASREMLYPQDALTVECQGGAAETDAFGLMMYYDNVPGLAARLVTWAQVQPRMAHILTVNLTMTAPSAVGQWGAGKTLDDSTGGDLLKANTDYAVLGYLTDTACTSVGIKGPDTGNVRVGGPGSLDVLETREWFVDLSNGANLPCIPIINSANKSATNVAQQNNAASGTPIIALQLAELRPAA